MLIAYSSFYVYIYLAACLVYSWVRFRRERGVATFSNDCSLDGIREGFRFGITRSAGHERLFPSSAHSLLLHVAFPWNPAPCLYLLLSARPLEPTVINHEPESFRRWKVQYSRQSCDEASGKSVGRVRRSVGPVVVGRPGRPVADQPRGAGPRVIRKTQSESGGRHVGHSESPMRLSMRVRELRDVSALMCGVVGVTRFALDTSFGCGASSLLSGFFHTFRSLGECLLSSRGNRQAICN